MKTSDYLKKSGTAEVIENDIAEKITYNEENAKLLFSIIKNNKDLLLDGQDEYFKEEISFPNNDGNNNRDVMNFMLLDCKYHINIKYTTFALLCLIYNIAMSEDFASFLPHILSTMSVIDSKTVRLDGMEKCVAYKLLKEKNGLSLNELEKSCECDFTSYNSDCGNLKNNGTCKTWKKKKIAEALKTLTNKNVIEKKGDKYELVF